LKILAVLVLAAAAGFAGVTVTESSTEGMSISLTAAVPQFGTVFMRGVQYATVTLDDAVNLSEAGFPRLPVYRTWIEIPIGATVDVSVNENRIETFDGTGLPVEPAVISAEKSRPRDSFTVVHDPSVYSQGTPYPSDWVAVEPVTVRSTMVTSKPRASLWATKAFMPVVTKSEWPMMR